MFLIWRLRLFVSAKDEQLSATFLYTTLSLHARSHGVAWGGNCPLGNRMPSSATPEDFLAISYCCFIFVAAKEKYPKILVESNFGLCSMQENLILS